MKLGLMKNTCVALLVAGMSSIVYGQTDGSGLKYTVAVDLVGETAADKETESSDKFQPREIEFIAFGPIDHMFDGMMSMAAHPGNEVGLFELHEAYISTSKLIPRSRLKVGQFFLGLGRINQIHRHDWAFTSAPKVHQEFFSAEGVLDSGVEFGTVLPLPFYLDLTVGVTNGFVYGHDHEGEDDGHGHGAEEEVAESEDAHADHEEVDKPKTPMQYARLVTSVGDNSQLGLNYLNRRSGHDLYELSGVDFAYKKRSGKILQLSFESEIWQQKKYSAGTDPETSLGGWMFGQYGMQYQGGLYFGLKYDRYTVTSLKKASGESLKNYTQTITPQVTMKFSEFSTFRLSYNMTEEVLDHHSYDKNSIEFQTVFIMGAHPAHSF